VAGSRGSAETSTTGGTGGFDAVDRFAAEARVQEAARARARRSSLGSQAEEEASLRGVLVDLGERAATVCLELAAGRTVVGVVEQVAEDHLQVRATDGRAVLVVLDVVQLVLPQGAGDAVTGAREVRSGSTLRHVLHDLAGGRAPVRVHLRSGATVDGELRSVGVDVLALEAAGDGRRRAHVPLGAVAEVWSGVDRGDA
jgi:hypothetical protein